MESTWHGDFVSMEDECDVLTVSASVEALAAPLFLARFLVWLPLYRSIGRLSDYHHANESNKNGRLPAGASGKREGRTPVDKCGRHDMKQTYFRGKDAQTKDT